MLNPTISPYRKRPWRPSHPSNVPTPAALTLVSATYSPGAYVELTFDRAVDISAFASAQVTVVDGAIYSADLAGVGPGGLMSETTVLVPLSTVGPPSDPGTLLNASADTGIVAVDDGGTWAGATNLALPFP